MELTSKASTDAAPPQTRGDLSRERLVAMAMEAFAAKGFHGCTTRDIALAADMSPAAMYVHYQSKEELLFLISREGHEATLRQVREGLASASDPVAQLTAMVRGFVHDHAEGHVRARVTNFELANLSPEHYRVVMAMRREVEETFCAVVEAGVRSGVFSTDDVRMTVRALLSLGIDTARWFRDGGRSSAGEVAEHYVGLALRMVGV
jgi:AcrR family transcriptional regulator